MALIRCVPLALCATVALVTGCDGTSPAATATSNLPDDTVNAVTVSEQRAEQLVEIARAMRDVDPNLAWPMPDAFWAEVRKQSPAADAAGDISLDGWQRPLLYVRRDMRSFRLYSAGPNGKDEYGHGDDVALRQGETIID